MGGLMHTYFYRIVFVVFLLCISLFGTRTDVTADEVGDYEVIVYMYKDFKGESMSFRLDVDMRQRLIRNIDGEWWHHFGHPEVLSSYRQGEGLLFGSMKVGAKIGVYLFTDIKYISNDINWGYEGGPARAYKYGPGDYANCGNLTSMILYRIKDEEPLGVLIYGADVQHKEKRSTGFLSSTTSFWSETGCVQFFPLPEFNKYYQKKYQHIYASIGNQAERIRLFGKNVKVELYNNNECKGQGLILSGSGSKNHSIIRLDDLKLKYNVKSLRVFQDPHIYMSDERQPPSKVRVEAPPASVSSTTDKRIRSNVTMDFDSDRPGMDYKNFELDNPDPELCRDACANDPNCQAYTYVKPGIQGAKARCWLKKTVPPARSNNCCVSGVKTAQTEKPKTPQGGGSWGISPSVSLETDTNRPGQDYKNFELDTPDPGLCQKACANDPNCQAYTYVKPGIQGAKARCWLKKAVPQAKSNNCCVSGVKK